jgi:hypothetical protein
LAEYDDHTLALAAEYLFSHPKATPREIREKLKGFGIEIGTHAPFNRLIPELIDRKWLRLFTPRDPALDAEIRGRCRELEDITVTRTSHIDDMACHTGQRNGSLAVERTSIAWRNR